MPEADGVNEKLNLSAEFPPVATDAWEAIIAADLKGADYEKKLIWRTEEGLKIRPYYREDALAGLGDQRPRRRPEGQPWEIAQSADLPADAIRADLLHEAGAHAVQELAYAVSAGADRLEELAAEQSPDEAAAGIEFVFAVGPSYFVEIAKLRAARLLWSQVATAFGASEEAAGRMRISVRTPRRNKSAADHYTNLLRVTTEALAAVIGGCDRLAIEPIGFDSHLAANVQHVLKEESHLDAVADPAGGSYYVEALTDVLAREAWKLFQQVEREGGFGRAVAAGSIEATLAEARAVREKSYASRRRALVGVNNYPNTAEKGADAEIPPPEGDGALPQVRIAEPFEALRRRTVEHARATGRYPHVLLLKRGDVKMKGARANFCLNFFGCAAFDVTEAEEYQGSDADLIVLCSSDPEYLALAQEVCENVSVPVLVAGYPKDQIDALHAVGVAGFVHMQSDLIETLTRWQDQLGIRRIA